MMSLGPDNLKIICTLREVSYECAKKNKNDTASMGENHNQKVVSYFLALNSIAKWYPLAVLPHKCESFA